jgi:tetratricopeptide (TPR) repeat protein
MEMITRFRIAAAAALLAALAAFPAGAQSRAPKTLRYADAMTELLMAEVATQRGDLDDALAIYSRLARELRDARIARRAVETAVRARAYEPALTAAGLLLELEPDSSLGRELIASLVASRGNLDKARDTLAELVEKSVDRGAILSQLSFLLAKFSDKAAVLEATRAIAAKYPTLPESRYAVGVAALVAGETAVTIEEARAALALKPGWPQGAILEAQGLRKDSPDDVIGYYQGFVARHPDAKEVWLQLGRELAQARRNADAREAFRAAEKIAPDEASVAYAIGLLSMQMEDWDDAEAALQRALDKDYQDPNAVYLSLGQTAESRKRFDDALTWYRKVDQADWVRAQLRIATIISRQQGLAAGREYLANVEPRTSDDRIQVIQAEAQLLRDAKAWRETYDMLSKAVEEFPDSYELLYDHAMAAERVDKIDVLETDLKRVIKMKPDYAHAYNALGYTLADRTQRLPEAMAFIQQALKLSPDDPFILDSLGWAQYRQGQFDDALKTLQGAYASRPDPEIAAHLGEVLWKTGQRDEARKVWKTALTENPDHESLLAVMQKFKP